MAAADGSSQPGLQSRLAQLSAPWPFTGWAAPFADFGACWDVCPRPDWLLWAAARMARTEQERREVVRCAATVADAAVRAARMADPRIGAAISTAQAWARGAREPADVAAAFEAAVAVADQAAELAAQDAARARRLLAFAPRRRLASVTASRALGAQLSSRATDRRRWAALAVAWTARSAAEADLTMDTPARWAASVEHVGRYAVLALSPRYGASPRAAAACAAAVRHSLRRPAVA